ncbi:Aerobic glycerol-3-phosphate dehydrogenase [Roseovarius albus]|uniref:Aerobic glycerol-3-phosphate dehydrogenase n=1 Tax=Roseovarius albus TaxID=1247867 RepID=A0A1X7A173_9RHOB|nr:FAD-dependent oxidoreductase [Roseovarius albus]SLN67125.1 Aerobic glycerol-3-phosphate dehydrogenase [Roseovarius albus]
MKTPESDVGDDAKQFDIAIIGGGINGASAAQHLSAAGYSVFLAEQDDFASGATSRSSRLLHCGLRHLANGETFWRNLCQPKQLLKSFVTARHDMLARDDITHNLPNRVRKIDFYLPIYSSDKYSPWQLDAAFAALKCANPFGEPLNYRRVSKSQFDSIPIAPWLRDAGDLKQIAVFSEYLFDWPERIALDCLFSAERQGATICNYTRLTKVGRLDEDNGWQLTLRSEKNSNETPGSEYRISAKTVMNLAGAWIDQVIRSSGSNAEPKCSGIKGIHIALRLPEAFQNCGVFSYNSLGEPLYCLPFRGVHYVGLTRTAHDGDPTGVVAHDDEIAWMIGEINRAMPRLSVQPEDILYTWAGVNPLTRDQSHNLGSREIKIHDLAADNLNGIFSLTGGAIMTHRRVARQLVKLVSKTLGSRQKPLDREDAMHYPDVAEMDFRDAAKHCARHEKPATLADLMLRRLGAGWDPDQGRDLAPEVAQLIAPIMGWDSAKIEEEVLAYEAILATERRKPLDLAM